ncbi:MAG TPA: nickel/cobalt transporter [Hyphomicrobium sp.]|nr:nickel/cobalt transporter [Hyphomicrobium sp.]
MKGPRAALCALTIVLALLAGLLGSTAYAQQQKANPFALPQQSQQQGAPPASLEPPGLLTRAWTWLLTQQSRMNREMAAAVKDLKSGDPVRAAGLLILIAFLYGVLHAAGPGHGKAVISSYVLTNDETVRRGIALSFLSAVFQAISAIVFVGIFALVLNHTSMQMRASEALLETLSWGFVAVIGALMLYRQSRSVFARPALLPAAASPVGKAHALPHRHDCTHEHHHPRDDGVCGHHHQDHHAASAAKIPLGQATCDHVHGPDCGCGHSHMPDPKDLQGAWSWRKALPLALSIGIRPCTGALLLLVFAMSQGMWWAGVLGTFAMSLGTALTVSVLATLAVSSRNLAVRLSGEGSPWAWRVQALAGFAGASLVFLMGSAFFVASLQGGSPL